MNYDEARQVDPDSARPDAGKWRWTTHNKRTGTAAAGYCISCHGHDTRKEAEEHQRQWMLDNLVFRAGESALAQYQCIECNEWTTGAASVRGEITSWALCTAHQTREVMDKHIERPSRVIHS